MTNPLPTTQCTICGGYIPAEERGNIRHIGRGEYQHITCPVSEGMPETPANIRDPAATLLEQAHKIVTGARRQVYGSPEDNFRCIAEIWTPILERRLRISLRAPDGTSRLTADLIALLMVGMKAARLCETPDHADSWRDVAGYAACGARASNADLSKGAP